jgi:hypothetical protein
MTLILIDIHTRGETFIMWNAFIDVAFQYQLLSKVTTISYCDCVDSTSLTLILLMWRIG